MTHAASPSAMRFPDRVQLPFSFDARRLRHDLESLSGTQWVEHFVRQNYDGEWDVLALRAPAGASHPILMIFSDPSARSFENTSILEACPYFQEVLARFACPLLSVRLMRLAPGSIIKEHRDHDLCFEDGVVRFHIPVTTNAEVDFRLNGQRTVMDPGTAWYLRLSDPHSVANRGASSRVHMVIDAVANPWVESMLDDAVCGDAAAGRGRWRIDG